MRVALRPRGPGARLHQRTANEATAIAGDLGLALKVDDTRRPDPKMPPAACWRRTRRRLDRRAASARVRVWLSAGQRASTVPALVGETERTAQLRLPQDGLTLADVSEIRSQTFPPDVVVAQTPPAEDRRPARVALLVNRGERGASYVMPDLIGVNGDRAADILRDRGFRVAVVGIDAVSRRRRRRRHPPEPAGRLPDRTPASRSRSR